MLATMENIDDVTQLYMEYLNVPIEIHNSVKDGITKFLHKHLERDVFVSCIYQNDDVVSMSMLSSHIHVPDADSYIHDGAVGLLKNIYTKPAFRNRHFASGCINELINLSYNKGYTYVYCKHSETLSNLLDTLSFKSNDTYYIKEIQ